MVNVVSAPRERISLGVWLLTLSAAAALVLLLIDYFMPHGAISQSQGTMLVVGSTGLMLGAALLIGLSPLPRWLFLLFNFLIVLDIICTGIVTYFLQAYLVLALMAVALTGWFAHSGPGAKAPTA
jgi:hypothetical protein